MNTFVAIADYTAVEESELSFNAGDLLNLIKEGDGGWWYCKDCKSLKEGWAPFGYLEIFAVDVTHGKPSFHLFFLLFLFASGYPADAENSEFKQLALKALKFVVFFLKKLKNPKIL